MTVGIILGGLTMGIIGNRIKKHWFISLGLIFFGLSYSLLLFPGNIIPSGIFTNIIVTFIFFLFGFIVPLMTTPLTTNIMLNVDKNMMGRVGSFLAMISCSAIPLGAAISGSLSEILSMTTLFAIIGIIIILVGIRMLFNKKFRELAG